MKKNKVKHWNIWRACGKYAYGKWWNKKSSANNRNRNIFLTKLQNKQCKWMDGYDKCFVCIFDSLKLCYSHILDDFHVWIVYDSGIDSDSYHPHICLISFVGVTKKVIYNLGHICTHRMQISWQQLIDNREESYWKLWKTPSKHKYVN